MTESRSLPAPRFAIPGWVGHVAKRIAQAIPILLLVTLLSFFLMKLAPGDFVERLRLEDPTISDAFIEAERARLGLDRPALAQYFIWLSNLLRGDLGNSFAYRIPALSLVLSRAGATLMLAIASAVMTWAIAIPLGVLSAIKQNTWVDRLLQVMSYTGQSMPSFVLAILLLFFAQNVPWLPVGGMTSVDFAERSLLSQAIDLLSHLLLPALALSVTSFAGLQRITRGAFLDVLRQDYIQAARAKGLPEWRVIVIHALRNAVNPLVTILGFEFASLLSGSFIAEFFFNWPGLGRLLLEAVLSFDINVVMAGLLLGAVMLVAGNLLADLMLQAIDPRIRLDA